MISIKIKELIPLNKQYLETIVRNIRKNEILIIREKHFLKDDIRYTLHYYNLEDKRSTGPIGDAHSGKDFLTSLENITTWLEEMGREDIIATLLLEAIL